MRNDYPNPHEAEGLQAAERLRPVFWTGGPVPEVRLLTVEQAARAEQTFRDYTLEALSPSVRRTLTASMVPDRETPRRVGALAMQYLSDADLETEDVLYLLNRLLREVHQRAHNPAPTLGLLERVYRHIRLADSSDAWEAPGYGK